MSTKYIASNWRLPNQENSSKSDNYGLTFDGSSEYIDLGNNVFFNTNKSLLFLHIISSLQIQGYLLVFWVTNKSPKKELIISVIYRYNCINMVLICIYFCSLEKVKSFRKYRVIKTSKYLQTCMWLKSQTKRGVLICIFAYK